MQQLCEAAEEEFMEIMALVGMAAKPLHVRRLQKALQEWVANPGKIFLAVHSRLKIHLHINLTLKFSASNRSELLLIY